MPCLSFTLGFWSRARHIDWATLNSKKKKKCSIVVSRLLSDNQAVSWGLKPCCLCVTVNRNGRGRKQGVEEAGNGFWRTWTYRALPAARAFGIHPPRVVSANSQRSAWENASLPHTRILWDWINITKFLKRGPWRSISHNTVNCCRLFAPHSFSEASGTIFFIMVIFFPSFG